MKFCIRFVVASLIIFQFSAGFAQSKKELELTLNNTASALDSVQQLRALELAQKDSLSARLIKFEGIYTTLKDKVLKHDFNPDDFSMIVDSLIEVRDSTFSTLISASKSLEDTLSIMSDQNAKYRVTIDSLVELYVPKPLIKEEEPETDPADRDQIIAELKQLKELLDTEILNQAEFDQKKIELMKKW